MAANGQERELQLDAEAALLEVACLQRRLAETDSSLADSELQLNAVRAEAHRLERENHELRQILLALEKGDTSRDAPAAADGAVDSRRAELSFMAECSASVLPAKVRYTGLRIHGCRVSALRGMQGPSLVALDVPWHFFHPCRSFRPECASVTASSRCPLSPRSRASACCSSSASTAARWPP